MVITLATSPITSAIPYELLRIEHEALGALLIYINSTERRGRMKAQTRLPLVMNKAEFMLHKKSEATILA